MAIHDITFVGGVTKVETAYGFRYVFSASYIIDTYTTGNYMVRSPLGDSEKELVRFEKIPDQLGATDIEEYVDKLAYTRAYAMASPSNGADVSLFGELQTTQRRPLIELKSAYPISGLRDAATTTGSATYEQVQGEYRMRNTANGADSVTVKTLEIGRDISHTDANVGLGVRFPAAPTGSIVAEWGYYDETDGVVIGYDATGIYISHYRSGVLESKVYSSNWTNEDGYASKVDLTKGQVWNIDFAHYGYGPVVCSIYTEDPNLNYRKYKVHRFEFDGGVNFVNPNLPIYAKVDNNGDVTAFDMFLGGRQFSIVGAYNPTFRQNGDYFTFANIGTTPTLIGSLRRKSAYKMVNVKFSEISISPNGTAYYWVVFGNTLTSPSWGNIRNQQVGETALEKDTTATDALDGIVVKQGFVISSVSRRTQLSRSVDVVLGNQQAISLFVAAKAGTVDGDASLDFLGEW